MQINLFNGDLSIDQSLSVSDRSVVQTSVKWDNNQTMYLKLGTTWEIGNKQVMDDETIVTTYARVNLTPILIAAAIGSVCPPAAIAALVGAAAKYAY